MDNIAQKSDYQLRWIAGNEASYPENEVTAARDELRKRENTIITKDEFNDGFNKIRNWLKIFFGLK